MINSHRFKIEVSDDISYDQVIDEGIFSEAFNLKLSKAFEDKVNQAALRYRYLTHHEFESHVHSLFDYLFKNKVKAGSKRRKDWNEGWQQNLDEFVASNYSASSLIPHYYRRGQNVMRFKGRFIMPENPMFENKMRELVLIAFLEKYGIDSDTFYEFGCGSCHNILTLAQNSKDKLLFATDWVDSSVEILKCIEAKAKLLDVEGHQFKGKKFDFFRPDFSFKLEPGSVALTFGSLEQVGTDYKKLLEYFLSQSDVTFVHIECFAELYHRKDLFSEMGYRYHYERNYLNGYFDALKTLEKDGKIKMTKEVRLIGGAYHDGWIVVHWKKIK